MTSPQKIVISLTAVMLVLGALSVFLGWLPLHRQIPKQ